MSAQQISSSTEASPLSREEYVGAPKEFPVTSEPPPALTLSKTDEVRSAPFSSSVYSVANDDFVAVNQHLIDLRRKTYNTPENVALAITAASMLLSAYLLSESQIKNSFSLTSMIVFAFAAGCLLFLTTATLLRQRLVSKTLTKMLSATRHLAQPEEGEQRRISQNAERLKTDLQALSSNVSATGKEVNTIVTSLHGDLASFTNSLATTRVENKETLDNLRIERATIVTNLENLRCTLINISAETSKDLSSITGSLQALFDTKSESLIGVIEERNKKLISSIEAAESKTVDRLALVIQEAAEKSRENGERSIKSFIDKIADQKLEQSITFDRQMQDAGLFIEEKFRKAQHVIESDMQQASRSSDELIERAGRTISKKSKDIQNALAQSIIELSHAFRDQQASIDRTFDKIDGFSRDSATQSERLAGNIEHFKTAVVQPLERFSDSFGDKSREVANELALRITSFDEAAKKAGDRMETILVTETGRLKEIRESSISLVKGIVANIENECVNVVSNLAEKLEVSLSKPDSLPINEEIEPQIVSKEDPSISGHDRTESQTREPNPAGVAQHTHDGGSWISQLLARADEEDTLYNKPASVAEIGRILKHVDVLIDADVAVKAWNAFKESKTANFSAALTPDGKRAVHAIRGKLDMDRDLYKYVNAYLEKIESLLPRAFSSHEDAALLEFMSSTNGKIYTILAHTCERI